MNAIGAYRPDMCELDGPLLARALVVVETRGGALAEAGDILQAIERGYLPRDRFATDLADVIAGTVGRTSREQVTVFKSVGLSIEDLILARTAADRLRPRRGPDRPGSA